MLVTWNQTNGWLYFPSIQSLCGCYLTGTGMRYSYDDEGILYFLLFVRWYNLALHIGNITFPEKGIYIIVVPTWHRKVEHTCEVELKDEFTKLYIFKGYFVLTWHREVMWCVTNPSINCFSDGKISKGCLIEGSRLVLLFFIK